MQERKLEGFGIGGHQLSLRVLLLATFLITKQLLLSDLLLLSSVNKSRVVQLKGFSLSC